MIRINLIAEVRADGKARRKPFLSLESGNEALGNILMASIIVVAMLFCGYKYFSLSSNLSNLGVKITDANQERERLKEILKKGEEFKVQRELLKQKVDLITQLKKNQSVPVHLLDQVSRNLPEFLWLDQVNERANHVTLAGEATNYNAVSNLYNNLRDSEYFNDVVLGTTQQAGEGVSFSMTCKFSNARDQVPEGGTEEQPAAVAGLVASEGGQS